MTDLQNQASQFLQIRLFGALLKTDILSKHRSIITPLIFSTPTSRRCAGTLLRLYDAIGKVPGHETLIGELVLEHQENAQLCVSFTNSSLEVDPDELVLNYGPELLELIERCHMQTCLTQALEHINNGDKSSASAAIARSRTTQTATDQGSYLAADLQDRYGSRDKLQGRGKRWPTGYPTVDHLLSGGPAVGEVHGFVGPTGCGKSRLLLNLLVNAAFQGAFAVYVSLEINKQATDARIDSILTGLSIAQLQTPKGQRRLGRAQEQLRDRGGDVWTIKFIPHAMDVSQVGQFLRSMHQRPDVLALDYMELLSALATSGSGNYWEDQARMYSQFHGITEELRAVGWLATQPTKGKVEGLDNLGQVSGSGHKSDPLDSFWSIYITGDQLMSEGRFGLFNLKNRWGPMRHMVRMVTDIKRSNMRVSEEDEQDPGMKTAVLSPEEQIARDKQQNGVTT